MNKQMLMGVVAGIGVATAGGVTAYSLMSDKPAQLPPGSAVAIEAPAVKARTQTAMVPAAAPPVEVCWDEEITVQVEPKDDHLIAGTATGAVVGGAIGNEVGDRDLATAAGAAAGAFIGRKIQQRIQDNRAETRTVTTIERRCGPASSR